MSYYKESTVPNLRYECKQKQNLLPVSIQIW